MAAPMMLAGSRFKQKFIEVVQAGMSSQLLSNHQNSCMPLGKTMSTGKMHVSFLVKIHIFEEKFHIFSENIHVFSENVKENRNPFFFLLCFY